MIPLTLSVLLLLTLTAALSGFSLRDFSRSRLETLCNEAEVPDRFSEILRSHPTMLLAADLFWLTGVILISIIFTHKYLEVPRNFSTPAVTTQFSIQILLILLMGILLLMVIPWTISRIAGERFLQLFWPVIKLLPVFLSPVIWLCWKIDEFSHRLAGKEDNKNGREANISEEILSVVEEGARGGILESEAGKMIQRVMELQDEDARELLKHFSKENQNSESPEELTIQKLMFSPFYIPETTGIDSLLETMQKEHVHMAIVIDEYGGVAGLVTMEDVLEEIVGDIVDEFDEEEEQMIFETGQNTLEVDARVHIDDLNEQYHYDLPEGKDFDTIGGFVITQIGKVPQPGETLTWQQLRIEVLESDERRINKLRIELDTSLVEEYDTDN